MNIPGKCMVFAICALLGSLPSCTDDFSRFQFGQKKPVRTAGSGAPNMSDATASDPDGGAGGTDAQTE